MKRPQKKEYPVGAKPYIDVVVGDNFFELFTQNTTDIIHFFKAIPKDKQNYRYAKDKWTIKEILLHIIDVERVFAYRAFVAKRMDKLAIMPNMDEDLYAKNAIVGDRTMQDLIAEFKNVRAATHFIFKDITETQSKFIAQLTFSPITARALGYMTIGHSIHHINVIKERYLN